ncbi:hypothetical protein CDD83_1721 [Cordyceps sp. RAO-2017]|nr:hypothetical protein CDD83_1721 [Cordyceps sp. RAO-2017]
MPTAVPFCRPLRDRDVGEGLTQRSIRACVNFPSSPRAGRSLGPGLDIMGWALSDGLADHEEPAPSFLHLPTTSAPTSLLTSLLTRLRRGWCVRRTRGWLASWLPTATDLTGPETRAGDKAAPAERVQGILSIMASLVPVSCGELPDWQAKALVSLPVPARPCPSLGMRKFMHGATALRSRYRVSTPLVGLARLAPWTKTANGQAAYLPWVRRQAEAALSVAREPGRGPLTRAELRLCPSGRPFRCLCRLPSLLSYAPCAAASPLTDSPDTRFSNVGPSWPGRHHGPFHGPEPPALFGR